MINHALTSGVIIAAATISAHAAGDYDLGAAPKSTAVSCADIGTVFSELYHAAIECGQPDWVSRPSYQHFRSMAQASCGGQPRAIQQKADDRGALKVSIAKSDGTLLKVCQQEWALIRAADAVMRGER